jgi:hypothetical protein
MVLINNITDISFNSNVKGDLNFKILFYNNYFSELKIKKTIFTKIKEIQSTTNILNLFNIKLDHSYIEIFHNSEHYKIQEILIQKQIIEDDSNFINFNIIAFKLEKGGILNWYTIFNLGKIYTKIIIQPSYFNLAKNLISYKKNYTELKLFTNFIMPSNNQISSITLDSIFNIMNKKILLPYSNTFFNDKELSLHFLALINPLPKLHINTKLLNNNSQLIQFNNFNNISIPEYKNEEFDNMIKNDGIIIALKPLRISDIGGEILKLEVVPDSGNYNFDLYNMTYDNLNNDLDIRFNVFSFEFFNNYSRQYFYDLSGTSIQDKHKIIINTITNKDIFIDDDVIKPNIYRIINPIPDQQNNQYLTITSDIITNKQRPIITGTAKPIPPTQSRNDAEIIYFKINKNNSEKTYDQSFNIHDLSNNNTDGKWVFDTSIQESELTDNNLYFDISSNEIEILIWDNSDTYIEKKLQNNGGPSGNIIYNLTIDSKYIEGYDISFQNIYYKNKTGEDNHLKMNILGITSDIFDEFNLEDSEIFLNFQNNFQFNINLFVRNMLNNDSSGNLYLSNLMNSEQGTIILKKNALFQGQTDISNGVIELYPKVLDLNNNFLKFNGTEGSISINTESKNKLFNNIIIDDIIVKITGLNNNNKLLININNPIKLQYSNSSLIFQSINDDFFHRLEFRPLPNVNVNRDISENLYYKVKTDSQSYYFIFERLNFFDQSILESNMETVIESYIYDSGVKAVEVVDGVEVVKTIENYKTTTNTSDISFNVTEENIYHFDMSDESNKGSRLRFFADADCTKELFKNYNLFSTDNINYNSIIWDDNETLAEYSENIDPGFPGAYVKIKIPNVTQIQGENTRTDESVRYSKIYYANKFKYNKNLDDVDVSGIIHINPKKDIEIKKPFISNLFNTTNGTLSYNLKDYNIFSTLYDISLNEEDMDWKGMSFKIDSALITNIQQDISYNYNNEGTSNGKLSIYNKGQWYDKQTFITTDVSFNLRSDEITKIKFNHELQNVILNISLIDCSNSNHPNDYQNAVFKEGGDLSLNKVFDSYGTGGFRDISYGDLSYNYYAILKNDDGENRTSFFEKYENDYSGNIYLLGAVINASLILCQVKLKNQPPSLDKDGMPDFEPQYKINFEDISGTKKKISSIHGNKESVISTYESETDICHNIICKDIIINKYYKNGSNRFENLNVETTLNLIFTDDKILYGIAKNNEIDKDNDTYQKQSSDYKIIGYTNDSHKLFIIIDEIGQIFFGDNNDNYIYLTEIDKNTSVNFKLVFSLQDISGNDNEEHNSYSLNLIDETELDISCILIRNVGGLSGELINNNNNIPMDIYNYTINETLSTEIYSITTLEKNDENIFRSGDIFSDGSGNYIGLDQSNNQTLYNDLSNANRWYDISGITGHASSGGASYKVDIDRKADISGGKHGFWFVIDLSQVEFVDKIAITGTNNLNSNPKSFYIYGSTCNDNKNDPSKNDQWTLLNRFSYIERFYNYEINKNEYNANNNYTIFRDLFVSSVGDGSGNTAIPFKFYRLVIFQNFGAKNIQLKNIKFFKKSVVMKNLGRENINYSTKYLNLNDYRTSKETNQLFDKIIVSEPFILDHSLQYDYERSLAEEDSKQIVEFTHYDTEGNYIGLINTDTTTNQYDIANSNYYEDFFSKSVSRRKSTTWYPFKGYNDDNEPIDENDNATFDLFKEGVYFTFEAKDINDILQSISIKGISGEKIDNATSIIVNDICANVQELSIFGKVINIQQNDGGGVEGDDSTTQNTDNLINEKYSDYFWDHICDVSYNMNDFLNSPNGYVKKWINNKNNYNKTYTFYRIVITKNFGGKYVYIEHILLERAKNMIDRREKIHILKDISYCTIHHKEQTTLSQTGFFNVKSNIREITLNNLNNDELIIKNRPYNDISLNEIVAHLCNIPNCSDLKIEIFGTKQALIYWTFNCSNVYVDINFNVYRMQISTDVETTNKKILLGTTKNKFFYDNDPIPYLIATYSIEPVITWENEVLKLDQISEEKLICKENRFPYGRYNVRYDNPKLFSFINGNLSQTNNTFLNEKIKTGSNCAKNEISSNPKTSILFKNTNVMTKKEIYTMLSKGASRPFR